MTIARGIHDAVPMQTYLADPAPEPSMSTGIVQALTERSPAHAYRLHPRLGGAGDDPSARGDLGSAIHSMVLGGAPVEYVGEVARLSGPRKGEPFIPDDWATKGAQTARDEIRARGGLPMLEHQRATIEAAAISARAMIDRYGPGKAEQTMVWQHTNGVWCRGRADWLTDDGLYDLDVKTCDNADPASWIRRVLFTGGLDIQATLRVMGHEAIGGRTRDVLFVLVEIEPPFGCSVVGVGPAVVELARGKIERAAQTWARCLSSGEWPSYGTGIHWAEPPAWAAWDAETRGQS